MTTHRKVQPNFFADVVHPRVGHGWRMYRLKTSGRKWATLQHCVSRKIIKLRIADWNKTQKRPVLDGVVQW